MGAFLLQTPGHSVYFSTEGGHVYGEDLSGVEISKVEKVEPLSFSTPVKGAQGLASRLGRWQ